MAQDGGRSGGGSTDTDPVLQSIREMRDSGASRAELRRQLGAQGYADADARVLIDQALGSQSAAVASQSKSRGRGGGGGSGILGTIAFVVVLNGLSYLFDWGWYFY